MQHDGRPTENRLAVTYNAVQNQIKHFNGSDSTRVFSVAAPPDVVAQLRASFREVLRNFTLDRSSYSAGRRIAIIHFDVIIIGQHNETTAMGQQHSTGKRKPHHSQWSS